MNEEEIIELVEELKENCQCWLEDEDTCADDRKWFEKEKIVLQNLLDLYNQEKEKNKKLEEQRKIDENSVIDLITQLNAEVERCCDLSAELDEASKVINLMAEDFKKDVEILFDTNKDIQDIKAYYFNKLKEKQDDK